MLLTYITAALAILSTLTTLLITIRNSLTIGQVHTMVKTDATPEALAAAKPSPKVPQVAITVLLLVLSATASFACISLFSGCSGARTIAAAPTATLCDMVAVGSGSTFAGVVCVDVVTLVKDVIAALPATTAARQSGPCKLAAIHHKDSTFAGSVCEAYAPPIQASLDR